MTLRIAVDFGTSSTCVAYSIHDREPQAVMIDGAPLMSSAVYAAADGTLFVGQEAERQAAVDPSRYEPHPKRRIDEGELLLGDTVLPVNDVVRGVLKRAVDEARRVAGDSKVASLVLTHPADWGALRGRVLRQAAAGLGGEVILVPEPVAAAVYHAATFTPSSEHRTVEVSAQAGETLAVLDLGGGTVDVSVVQRHSAATAPAARRGGFQVLATRGDPSFGGADIDQALLEHVGELVSGADGDGWRKLVEGRELPDRRRRRVLRQDVRGAKETLSRHAYTDVPMPPPFADAHITRPDLEALIEEPLGRAAEMTVTTISDAGLRPKQLAAIFLVGGSSRIPMISRLVHERSGVMPTTLDQPETVVARGALRAVTTGPDRTGSSPAHGPRARGASSAPAVGPPAGANQQRPAGTPAHGGPPGPAYQQAPSRQGARQPGTPHQQGAPQQGSRQHGARRPEPVSRPPSGPPAPGYDPPTQRVSTSARPARRSVWLWIVSAAAALVAAITVTLILVLGNGDSAGESNGRADGGSTGDPGQQQATGQQLSRHQFTFWYPQDWVLANEEPSKKKVEVAPPDGGRDNVIVVQQFQLNTDSSARRDVVVDELRRKVDEAGSAFGEFEPETRYAGRKVAYYRQRFARGSIDWYVVFDGYTQVSVGCQQDDAGSAEVRGACRQVVGSATVVK